MTKDSNAIAAEIKDLSFEAALKQLEEIVQKLEKGQVDLEDSIAPDEKIGARATVREMLAARNPAQKLYIRVNALDTGMTLGDLAAVVALGDHHHYYFGDSFRFAPWRWWRPTWRLLVDGRLDRWWWFWRRWRLGRWLWWWR